MLRATATLAACLPLLAAAGCGSSGSSSQSGSAAATGSSASGSSLKVSTTPKYATPPASAPVLAGTVNIAYRNITIAPDTVRVRVGTKLRWTNYDPVQHNVTSRGGPQRFVSPPLGEGATYTITATRPGLIRYECTIHPTSMNGSIEVVR